MNRDNIEIFLRNIYIFIPIKIFHQFLCIGRFTKKAVSQFYTVLEDDPWPIGQFMYVSYLYFEFHFICNYFQTQNGYVKRVLDDDIKSMVLEIMGTNVSTMYISTPRDPKKELGIKLPFLVLLIKNMHKCFSFEVKVSTNHTNQTMYI